MLSKPIPPTEERICNRSWQNPRDSKRSKHQAPQLKSFSTVKKQMVRRLPITATHNAPVNKIKASIPQIIPCENLFPSCSPYKERDMRRSLSYCNSSFQSLSSCFDVLVLFGVSKLIKDAKPSGPESTRSGKRGGGEGTYERSFSST